MEIFCKLRWDLGDPALGRCGRIAGVGQGSLQSGGPAVEMPKARAIFVRASRPGTVLPRS